MSGVDVHPWERPAEINRLRERLAAMEAERDLWRRRAEFMLYRRSMTEADIKRGQEIWRLLEDEIAALAGEAAAPVTEGER